MNTPDIHPLRTPIIHRVDVVIFGSGTGTVAAAVKLKALGYSVMAVSDRPYFGSESAGSLELDALENNGDPLISKIFKKDEGSARNPASIKRGLDQALMNEGIPFAFLSRPVALLRSEAGAIAGVLLAFRTSLLAVECRAVLDLSNHGYAARLSPKLQMEKGTLAQTATLVATAEEVPEVWKHKSETLNHRAEWLNNEGQLQTCGLHRLKLEMPTDVEPTVASLSGLEHTLRAAVTDVAFLSSADALEIGTPWTVVSHANNPNVSALEAFDCDGLVETGLYLAGPGLPLNTEARALLKTADGAAKLACHAAENISAALDSLSFSKPVFMDAGQIPQTTQGLSVPKFDQAFVRQTADSKSLEIPTAAWPDLAECDVLVAGGGTGGAPAAIAAARSGSKTIVLEMQHGLGGVGTLGLIACYYFGNRVGFTAEIDREMDVLDPVRGAKKNSRWNPELKMSWYHRELKKAGGSAWLGSFAFGVEMNDGNVSAVLVSTPFGCGRVKVKSVIDSTGNADIAAAAGAPCRVIGAEHVAVQGTGLSPRCPTADYRNSDHTFIDDCDMMGVTHAHVVARAKFHGEFDTSPLVDSRERRQIIGEIELSPLDFLAGRTFPDTINTAESNFDTHGFTIHPVFMVCPPNKKPLRAHVPFRCLLPQGIKNVLVTGLGISAHRDAIPVVRMQPDVQNQGYAAGLAAAESAATNLELRNLNLRTLQEKLVDLKILESDVPQHEDSFPLAQRILQEAANGNPDQLFEAAVLFAHEQEAAALLVERLNTETSAEAQAACALVLGMMGRPEAGPVLEKNVSESSWDEGWNYRGMGQFGRSMSVLDAQIIALAKSKSANAAAVIAEKTRQLDADAALSHCRAVAVAAGLLQDRSLNAALTELLSKPPLVGHAHLATKEVASKANNDSIETAARNLALRELHVARGLYLGGDPDGQARAILSTYAQDLRGHLARHAQALLEVKPGTPVAAQ